MSIPVDEFSDLPLARLRQYWGYDSFRPLQREAINCAMQQRDSVVVLPTGAGKSLCYQVPALCTDRLAVVVSPLISLMKDQVDSLAASGISAASINSSMGEAEKRLVAEQIRRGELRLLYLAPERLVLESTIKFLQNARVAFFAIDEAHCISSWGHDFRPEYRQLNSLKTHFPDVSVHAFTATATPRVREDIAIELQLTNPQVLVGSFDRENLLYRVYRRTEVLAQLREVIDRYRQQSGIVYCISRKEVENVAETLNRCGYRALPYHAGLSNQDRSRNQDDFINDRVDIIVATVAFGMGIDKSNVRYVVHAGMPKSLEAYQQESGRAGRDGLQSECTLLFSGSDLILWKKMTDSSQPGAGALLDAMYSYCTRTSCRHRMLVEYFGQSLGKSNCNACDVCLEELPLLPDALVVAQKIISCVHRLEQRFGAHHVAQVLIGSKAKRILDLGHERLSTWALLSDHPASAVGTWIGQLVDQGFLVPSGEYSVLRITDLGRQVLRGETIPVLYQASVPQPRKSTECRDDWAGVDSGLFESLRALRRQVAEEKQIPPFVIFHDTSLREMARQRPSKVVSFGSIPGVGAKKLADYGVRFVESIIQYCSQHNLPLDQPGQTSHAFNDKGDSSGGSLTPTKVVSKVKLDAFAMFSQGLPIEEIAAKVGRAVSTTSGYLSQYIQEHRIMDPSPWVDPATAARIRSAVNQVGALERLGPIKELLGEDYSYLQIRVVVDCLRVEHFRDHRPIQ
ncbi:MAG: DNA helicase RecQ [Planctomycetota bacterium]|nr:DNA helicase RecQ [Planctomycetota bacterium]MDA1177702.1 DNA helicase RecQ [Planctomycetota bacterium]